MGSPLGLVIENIFMVELETTLVPKLENHVQKWRRFADDTFAYVKVGSVDYVLPVLNWFYKNIKFTYEEEQNNTLPFLDVLFIRDGENLTPRFTEKIHIMACIYTGTRLHQSIGKEKHWSR